MFSVCIRKWSVRSGWKGWRAEVEHYRKSVNEGFRSAKRKRRGHYNFFGLLEKTTKRGGARMREEMRSGVKNKKKERQGRIKESVEQEKWQDEDTFAKVVRQGRDAESGGEEEKCLNEAPWLAMM